MSHLLAETLPLAFAAAVSPVLLLVEVTTLTGSDPVRRGAAVAAGAAIPLLVVAAVALAAGVKLNGSASAGGKSAIDFAFGALLLALALVTALHKPRVRRPEKPARRQSVPASFAIGIAAMATNVSTMALWASAMSAVAYEHVSVGERIVVCAVELLIVLLVVLIPLTARIVAPRSAGRMLDPLGSWMAAHQRAIGVVLLVVFGAYLIVKGAIRLSS